MKFGHIVVTNDDGIDAPGLAVAERLAARLAEQVWVFAPATDQSGVAQALSLHQPLRVDERGPRRYAVAGTPADCMMIALGTGLMDGQHPDLVISGVNRGHNLSDSIMYSGTVGAALTAVHFDLPAIALSQAFSAGQPADFSVAEAWTEAVLDRLWSVREGHHFAWNVNFPAGDARAIAGLRFTRQIGGSVIAPQISTEQAAGRDTHWVAFERALETITQADSDVAALRDGFVSAMPLKGERCDEARLEALGAGNEWPLEAKLDAALGGVR